jgi:hypothetical protein
MEKMTRRDLLKAIVAGSGGIVAAGFLPEKWLKPVVKSGVLPVHAQASAPPDFIQGGYFDGDFLIAFAFVSSQPIPEFFRDNHDLSSVKKIGVEYPVEGKDVTLFVDDVEESKKITDEDGYVEWVLEWDTQQPTAIDPTKETKLKFVMVDGYDEVIYPGWA